MAPEAVPLLVAVAAPLVSVRCCFADGPELFELSQTCARVVRASAVSPGSALVLIEGLPYKEAAQIIGVPMGTLTSRLARGRQALQQLLGPGDSA